MRVPNLHIVAGNLSAVYRIVFTGLLLFELVRFGLRNRSNHVEYRRISDNSRGNSRGNSPHRKKDSLWPKKR